MAGAGKGCRSLSRLREQRGAFLLALDGSPALRPYANLLRDLVDDRPRVEKIAEAIRQRIGGISLLQSTAKIVWLVRQKLERDLPALALAEVPCDPIIKRYVLLKKNAET